MLFEKNKILQAAGYMSTKTKASHMSNAKWRKIIETIEKSGLTINESHWQLLGKDSIYKASGFPKIQHINQTGFNDGAWGPPHPFSDIYRLIIPKLVEDPRSDKMRPLPKIIQPTEALMELLSSTAHFPISMNAQGLELNAYDL